MNRVGYFLRRPALLLSLLFILLVVMSALFAPWLTPFDPDEQFVEGLSLEGAPTALTGWEPICWDAISSRV